MTWEEFIQQKDRDSFKRLFAEMIIIVFNDILSRDYYEYHMKKMLQDGSQKSKKKIQEHNDSINWLLSDNRVKEIAFQYLGLSHLTKENIMEAIAAKFNQSRKFHKFFNSYAKETDMDAERAAYNRTREELK